MNIVNGVWFASFSLIQITNQKHIDNIHSDLKHAEKKSNELRKPARQ